MKILQVAHGFPPECIGGTERFVERIAHGLVDRGHAVSIFAGSLHWEERFRIDRTVQGALEVLRVHRDDLYFDHWDKVDNPHVAQAFEDELARTEPEVVHLHHWIRLDGSLVRRAAARGVPVIVHLHDLFTTCPRVFRIREQDRFCEESMGESPCSTCVPRWKFQGDREIAASLEHYSASLRAELDAAASILVPSASHARSCEQWLQRAPGSLRVLAHPNMGQDARSMQRCAHSSAGRLRVSFFSHAHPVKGLHVVAAALQSLGPESGVELDVFGAFSSPEYEARVKALLAELPVRFHGAYRVGEPAATETDCVVVPSLAAESHSFWLDEALAMGVPILASDFGSLRDRGGERVRRIPRGDVSAWAQALRELRDDLGERTRRASVAVPPLAAVDAYLADLEGLYRQALEAPPTPVVTLAAPSELAREWDRREWAFRELLRSEDWESVVSDLQRKLADRAEGDDRLSPGAPDGR